jgi:copper transport protein
MPGGVLLRALATALLLALAAGGALAHAQLQASDPAADAVLETAPAEVRLTFSEPVAPLVLRWIAPGGTESEVDARTAGQALAVTPPPDLGRGTHLLSWRVVSTDGHPVGGTFAFSIGAPSAAPSTAADVAAGTARLAAAARFALTLALVVGVGGAVCLALVRPDAAAARAVRPVVLGASVGVLPLAALAMGAQGLDMLALGPMALAEPRPWIAAWGAPIRDTALLAAAAALAALAALRGSQAAALLAWGLAAVSFAASGHAPVAPPAWIAAPAVALHGLALVFWMGALLPLAGALRAPAPEAALRRFSALAVPLVALLVASGATLAWLQSRSLGALMASDYGRLLAVKLALVAALLALALRNRVALTPAVARGEAAAARALSRAVRAEILIGLAVLALASGFRLTPPPRALAAAAEPVYLHLHGDRAMADLKLAPGLPGSNMVTLGFQTPDFAPLEPREVRVSFALPERGIEPIRLEALPAGDGLWRAGPVTLPLAGDWKVTLRLLVTDFDQATLTETLFLGSPDPDRP